ncbi:hypothetical protein GUJ93_ZPchr0011g27175 [Zizania palustris]|uniref:Uncharacterized protein n=1 Tax=Zizania palustris TaxID=103762 RepID=A0A8J5WHQ5_ZIZPA|nr:hypothetical protein GUJ93_ZPchr0011g27175 [Zizania palustris]
MAGLIASSAVKWALDKLSSLLPATPTSPTAAASSGQGELEVEDIRMLERTMRRIHATLEDAEQHWNIREESAKLRLQELKDLAYDAEDVVEEYEYEVNRFKVEEFERLTAVGGGADGGSSKRKRLEIHEAGMVPVPRELADRARKVIERFCEIKEYSDSFKLSENDGERRIVPDIHSVRQTSSFVYAPRILGRNLDKERVIARLFSGEGSRVGGRISVLAIVGMGGLGKTTLAQLVYNDPGVRQSFDLCAWVCVSECFDVQNITRKIISSLKQESCDHVQSGQLQGLLADQIQEKRVFLVLDDVWNERSDCWEMLCMPMFACTCCHIVVTTRNEAVARLVQTMPSYNLHCLSPDESWSFFKQTAFVEQENVSPAANLVEIGKRVAEKCKGLPLALKTLGSVLRFETNEKKWREVLESELWELQQSQQEVLPALELSYRHMPIYLKRCFVALSLYPKASYLDEGMIVWLWKLLGLLHSDGIYDMDEIGNIYVNELVERSLFQCGLRHRERVMHDLVHDLACFLAGEEFFRLDSEENTEVPQGARYMLIVPKAIHKSIRISNASKSLRAIIMERKIDIENPEELFLNCNKFRVVHIKGFSIAKVEHIGREFSSHDQRFSSLVSLCFEDMCRLSEWSEVGDGEFPRLETLDINNAIALRSLPSVPFLSLRDFSLHYCTNLVAFPSSATLQKLYICDCERLKELPALPSLWSLELFNCPSLVTFGHFPLLTVLHLSDQFEDEILTRFVNSHQMLEELSVSSDTLISICLEPQSLPSLRKLELRCPNLQYCHALANLTSLKILDTYGSPQLLVPDSLRRSLEQLYTCDSFFLIHNLSITSII